MSRAQKPSRSSGTSIETLQQRQFSIFRRLFILFGTVFPLYMSGHSATRSECISAAAFSFLELFPSWRFFPLWFFCCSHAPRKQAGVRKFLEDLSHFFLPGFIANNRTWLWLDYTDNDVWYINTYMCVWCLYISIYKKLFVYINKYL